MLFFLPAVRRPRSLISPENIQANERRRGPPAEAEARRRLRVRRSRNVLRGQQAPDPVPEDSPGLQKPLTGPSSPPFSGPELSDHRVCLECNEGTRRKRETGSFPGKRAGRPNCDRGAPLPKEVKLPREQAVLSENLTRSEQILEASQTQHSISET